MGSIITVTAPSFTRPSDTTTYGSGDLAANSTDNAAVVPLVFDFPDFFRGGPQLVRRCRLRKTDNDVSGAAFRLHLFSGGAPTFTTNGDNSAISGNTNLPANGIYSGGLDIPSMTGFVTYAVGWGVPVVGTEVIVEPVLQPNGKWRVWGCWEARGAYQPTSGGVYLSAIETLPID